MISAIDTETTGTDFFHGCRPYIVTACNGKNNYLWTGEVDPQTRNVHWDHAEILDLRRFIESSDEVIFHNTNFDRRALESIDVHLPQGLYQRHDTLVASHIVCSGDKHGLKELSIKYLSYFEDDKQDLKESIISIRDSLSRNNPNNVQYAKKGHPHFPAQDGSWQQDMWLDMDKAIKYACGDVERTWLLHKVFQKYILENNLLNQYWFRMKVLPVLYKMQTRGINVYTNKVVRLKNELELQLVQLQKLIQSSSNSPYNIVPTKPEDLRLLLYTVMGLTPPKYTESGLASTDEGTLNKLQEENDDNQTIRYLKGWRKANKIVSDVTSYLKWCHKGAVHSTVNLTGTHWTRQTSNDPNQQNFNKKLKFLFGPKPGFYWLYADVVNIELRIWAYDCGAKALIKAFEEGESVHMVIAYALYPEIIARIGVSAYKNTKTYTKCKGGTFARIYGGSDRKVNETYGVSGAVDIIKAKLPEVDQYFKQLEAVRSHNGDVFHYPRIYTMQGYPLDVPINKPYTAGSGRIQGTASIIVQDMMIEIDQDRVYNNPTNHPLAPQELACGMIQQVHDSLTIEIPEHEESDRTDRHLVDLMERVGERHMPTCPMDYEIIKCHEHEEPEFRDFTFIPRVHNGYEIEMYMHNHQYKGEAVFDKDTLLVEYGKTKQEVVERLYSKIDKDPVQ